MKKFIILTIFILNISTVFPARKVIQLPYFKNNWDKIAFLKGDFYLLNTDKVPENFTKVKIAYDKKFLFLKITCKEEKIANVIKSHTGPDIWQNDCVEIFIDTNFDRKSYYQFIVSVDGQIYGWDAERVPVLKGWSASNKVGDDYWETEIKIPFSILNIEPQKGRIIGMTFCRERWAEVLELSTWTPPRGFHKPEDFGIFVFGSLKDVIYGNLKNINYNLKILKKEIGKMYLSQELEDKIDLLEEFKEKTENYFTLKNIDNEKFIKWVEDFFVIKNSVNIEELIYKIRIEKLLSM